MEEGSLFQRMKQIFHEDEMDEEMQKEAAGTKGGRSDPQYFPLYG